MTVRADAWPQGTPAWVDLMVPDLGPAKEFYGPLFGWEFSEGAPETGYYTMCLKDGEPVAGIGQAMDGQPAPPPAWTTYIAVDDVDASAAKVTDAGGQLLMPVLSVMEFGRMAVAVDAAGAVFGMWESGTHTGANRTDEPGSVAWNEAMSHDFEKAKAFYAELFGYGYGDMSGDGFAYATLDLDGRPVGGIGGPGAIAADASPHWMTYFKVEDADATVDAVRQQGGTVVKEPEDSEFGRMAIVQGPNGETFSVMADVPEGG